jgi:hypothetical protein
VLISACDPDLVTHQIFAGEFDKTGVREFSDQAAYPFLGSAPEKNTC